MRELPGRARGSIWAYARAAAQAPALSPGCTKHVRRGQCQQARHDAHTSLPPARPARPHPPPSPSPPLFTQSLKLLKKKWVSYLNKLTAVTRSKLNKVDRNKVS